MSKTALTSTLLAFLSGCTVFSARAASDPPRVESHGLIDGHLALGFPGDDELLGAELLGGRGSGSLARLNLLKLVRLEIGALGATVGVGPIDVGLGTFFYSPRPPEGRRESPTSLPAAEDEDRAEDAPSPDVIQLRGEPH